MRIFSVPQFLLPPQGKMHPLRQHRFRFQRNVSGAGRQPFQFRRDHAGRIASRRENLSRQLQAHRQRRIAALSISLATRSKSAGSVTTVTLSKFFAAERSIVGPPISMFSTSSRPSVPLSPRSPQTDTDSPPPDQSARFHCSAACF